jgi:hypothetical protein
MAGRGGGEEIVLTETSTMPPAQSVFSSASFSMIRRLASSI